MQKKLTMNLTIERDGFTFIFNMPIGVSYGIAYDAAFSILTEVSSMAQSAVDEKKNLPQPEIAS